MTTLRWTGSLWFLPALFLVTCLEAASVNPNPSPYPTSSLANSSLALAIGGAMTAAFVALKFGQFPRFVSGLRAERRGLSQVLVAWWSPVLTAAVVVCLAVMVSSRAVPTDRGSWSVVSVDFCTTLACAVLGLVLRWALPVVVAVPVAAVIPYAWIGYAPSTDNRLLHNMDSYFAGCCGQAFEPAHDAVRAALTLSLVLCLAVAGLLLSRRWTDLPRSALVVIVGLTLVGSFGAGAGVARASGHELSLSAVEPRSTALACTTDAGLRVCAWPEAHGSTRKLAGIARALNVRLEHLGLGPVTGITQGRGGPGEVSVSADDQMSDDNLRVALSAGYVDRQAGCDGTYGGYGDRRDDEVAFVARAAGVSAEHLTRVLGSPHPRADEQWARAQATPAAVKTWFIEGLALVHCDVAR